MPPEDGFYVCPGCKTRYVTNAEACACACDWRVHMEF